MSLRDNQLFEITEVEIAKVDCIFFDIRRYFEIPVFAISRVECIITLSATRDQEKSH